MLQQLTLEFFTDDQYMQELCKTYWQMSTNKRIPYFTYTYDVKDIADSFGYQSWYDVSTQVSDHCTVLINCSICGQEQTAKNRAAYNKLFDSAAMHMNHSFQGIICQACRDTLPKNRFVRSLQNSISIHYFLMRTIYKHVLGDVCLSKIIIKDGFTYFSRDFPYYDDNYYSNTKFGFVIYDAIDEKPVMVVDIFTKALAGDDSWENEQLLKKNILDYFDVPYYILPRDAVKVYNEEAMEFLVKYYQEREINKNPSAKENIIISSKINNNGSSI